MEFFLYLAAALLAMRIKQSLKFSPLRPKWNSILLVGWWLPWVIYTVASIFLDDLPHLFVSILVLTAYVVFALRQPDFRSLRDFFKGHLPLIIVSSIAVLVNLIKPDFYDAYGQYFGWAMAGAFVWIFASWFTNKKQRDEFRAVTQQKLVLDNLVAQRTAELTQQKNELQHTLELLQTTQQQLIQSEKLASLGEVTAGIAHEIQNPLNFVNNFSEVSMELITEMEEELAKGDTEEAVAIAQDIKQNLEKIIHHGKRADSIVKGMLQHSRASSNVKEPTDINKLADEYLRLAYHGLRAKDKSFNAELITHFDENLPEINMVPQDIGRVLLNIFNNAFYAVQKKQAVTAEGFKPTIEVSTSRKGKSAIITIKDNGIGMPDEVKEKIMQPFFTTKPTGEGTGLGLSLSFDIVVKGHGGTIDVKSDEGQFSEFIISLPL